MKKILVAVLSVLAFAAVASAQPRAIGIRAGYGGELSYQHGINAGFVEADLGFLGGYGFNVTGIYDFVFGGAGDVNFYVGPGLQFGAYNNAEKNASVLNAAIVGQLGFEWLIPGVPMNISLDWRPAFAVTGYPGFYASGVGLGLRYRF